MGERVKFRGVEIGTGQGTPPGNAVIPAKAGIQLPRGSAPQGRV